MPSPILQLDYATRRPRRLRRWSIVSALLLTAVCIGWYKRQPLIAATWGRYQAHLCHTHRLPADQIVYEEEPAEAHRLLASSGYYPLFEPTPSRINPATTRPARTFAGQIPDCWLRHAPALGLTPTKADAVLFMHERQSKSGNKRLVILTCDTKTYPSAALSNFTRFSDWIIVSPASNGQPSKIKIARYMCGTGFVFPNSDEPYRSKYEIIQSRISPPSTQPDGTVSVPMDEIRITPAASNRQSRWIRFFAGQPDGKDLSHFTIVYETERGRGTIDGYLHDDDWLNLSIRDGPSKSR